MRFAVFALLLTSIGVSHASDLSNYGKVFVSRDGQTTLEIVPFKVKNAKGLQDALIRVRGPIAESEGIDGKIIRHQAIHAGTGMNFQYYSNERKKWLNRMGSRDSWWGSKFYELWYGGTGSVKIWLDENASKELNTKHFWSEFKKQKF